MCRYYFFVLTVHNTDKMLRLVFVIHFPLNFTVSVLPKNPCFPHKDFTRTGPSVFGDPFYHLILFLIREERHLPSITKICSCSSSPVYSEADRAIYPTCFEEEGLLRKWDNRDVVCLSLIIFLFFQSCWWLLLLWSDRKQSRARQLTVFNNGVCVLGRSWLGC